MVEGGGYGGLDATNGVWGGFDDEGRTPQRSPTSEMDEVREPTGVVLWCGEGNCTSCCGSRFCTQPNHQLYELRCLQISKNKKGYRNNYFAEEINDYYITNNRNK